MKIAIQFYHSLAPHAAGPQMEIIEQHLQQNDEIFLITCFGDYFKFCELNINLDKKICSRCNKHFKHLMRFFNKKKIHIVELNDTDIDYDILPKYFTSIDELKNFYIDSFPIGINVASTLITQHNEVQLDTKKYQKQIYNTLKTAYFIYEKTTNILQRNNIDVLYFHNGRFFHSGAAKAAAKKLSVNFYATDILWNRRKYSKVKNSTFFDLNYTDNAILETWDNCKDDEYKVSSGSKFFYDLRFKEHQGLFIFNKDQIEGTLPKNFDFNKKNIVIFNSSLDEKAAIPEHNRKKVYNNELDGIKSILKTLKNNKEIYFYLRIHPRIAMRGNPSNSQLRFFKDEVLNKFKNCSIIWSEENIDSYALLLNCEKIITFGSTMGIETTFWNKISISADPNNWYNFLDVVYKPETHLDLIQLIQNNNLAPKSKIGAIKYGFWQRHYGENFKYFKRTSSFWEGEFKGVNMRPLMIIEKAKIIGKRNLRNLLNPYGKKQKI